jgi:c-di-GMP-binding flagellar brake protein YcgR
MLNQSELDALLAALPPDLLVSIGVGAANDRRWFRCKVHTHDAERGRLELTCFLDRPNDRPLEPGERVVLSARRSDAQQYAVPTRVESSSGGPNPRIVLRMAGKWRPEDERREQARIPFEAEIKRARHWTRGSWHEVGATLADLGSRGIGVLLDREVRIGDRLSLVFPLGDGPDMRVTLEVRHVRPEEGRWRTGGLFRALPPAEHERIVRYIFAEMRRSLSE